MKYIIFKTTHRATGQYFIGKIRSKKWTVGGNYKYGSGGAILSMVKEHGKDAFDRVKIKTFDCAKEATLFKNSQINIDDPLCINIKHYGAISNTGKPHSKSAIAKIRKAMTGKPNPHKGVPFTADHCAKISAAVMGGKNHNFGKEVKQSTRDKISAANLGRKDTPQARKNKSEAAKCRYGIKPSPPSPSS